MSFFPNIEKIRYEGPGSSNPFAFKHYNPEEKVGGKTIGKVNITSKIPFRAFGSFAI